MYTGYHAGVHKTSGAAAPGRDVIGDDVLADIERAMIRIRRRQSRRALGQLAVRSLPAPPDLQQVAVVDAIEEGNGLESGCVTVGLVAERLGLDPSRASRLVASTIEAGFVRRTASQRDGRRTCLELTAAGQAVVEAAHRSRRTLYSRMLSSWDESERVDFARLLARFSAALDEVDVEDPGTA